MKVFTLQEAERSADMDIKLVVVRASQFRVFGSSERIPTGEMAVVDLRDGDRPDDFDSRFQILGSHPVAPIHLVRIKGGF